MNVIEPTTSCCVCCKEIPLDAAFTPEGTKYVEHFCGLDCYERFQARAKAADRVDSVSAGDSHMSESSRISLQ